MAGGSNAEAVLCFSCLGKAVRTYEGLEDDHYRCTCCAKQFGIDWSQGQPQEPAWSLLDEELEMARKRQNSVLRGFDGRS